MFAYLQYLQFMEKKIVLRLLERSNFMFSKEKLGFNERNLKVFDNILSQPYGILLVTGPTGSGKTTTLYATLKELNKIEKKYSYHRRSSRV